MGFAGSFSRFAVLRSSFFLPLKTRRADLLFPILVSFQPQVAQRSDIRSVHHSQLKLSSTSTDASRSLPRDRVELTSLLFPFAASRLPRKRYSIEPSGLGDCGASFCCEPCSVSPYLARVSFPLFAGIRTLTDSPPLPLLPSTPFLLFFFMLFCSSLKSLENFNLRRTSSLGFLRSTRTGRARGRWR